MSEKTQLDRIEDAIASEMERAGDEREAVKRRFEAVEKTVHLRADAMHDYVSKRLVMMKEAECDKWIGRIGIAVASLAAGICIGYYV